MSTLISVSGGILLYSGVRDLLPAFGGIQAIYFGMAILIIGLYAGLTTK